MIQYTSIAIVLESSNGLSCGIYLNKWESNDCQQERESYDFFVMIIPPEYVVGGRMRLTCYHIVITSFSLSDTV